MFTHFYNQTIRRYVIAFGTMFNKIQVGRYDSNFNEVSRSTVPLAYAPKRRFYSTLVEYANRDRTGDPDDPKPGNVRLQQYLPRMAFAITDISYDAQRGTVVGQGRKIVQYNDADSISVTGPKLPYRLGFELTIYTKQQEDGYQILEQILPFFTPSLNVTVKSVRGMEQVIRDDMILNLDNISPDLQLEGSYDENLEIYTWILNFTAQIYLYGPVLTQGIIRSTDTTFMNLSNGKKILEVDVDLDPLGATPGSSYGFDVTYTDLSINSFGFNTAGLQDREC